MNRSSAAIASQDKEEEVFMKNIKNIQFLNATLLLQLKQEIVFSLALNESTFYYCGFISYMTAAHWRALQL